MKVNKLQLNWAKHSNRWIAKGMNKILQYIRQLNVIVKEDLKKFLKVIWWKCWGDLWKNLRKISGEKIEDIYERKWKEYLKRNWKKLFKKIERILERKVIELFDRILYKRIEINCWQKIEKHCSREIKQNIWQKIKKSNFTFVNCLRENFSLLFHFTFSLYFLNFVWTLL